MGNEWGGGGFGGLRLATNENLEPGAWRGVVGRHEADGDGAAERRGKAARGDDADLCAVLVENRRALTGRGAFDEQTNANAIEHAAEFGEDTLGAGEIGRLAAALGDGEVEAGFDRGDGLVEVVTVE